MRLFNYCGVHRCKRFDAQKLPTSFVTSDGTTYKRVDHSKRRRSFGNEVAMYKTNGIDPGGEIVRVFVNGTMTFAGMKTEDRARLALLALTGRRSGIEYKITSVRCKAKSSKAMGCEVSKFGPAKTSVQTYKSGIVIATGKTVDLAIGAVRAYL